LPEVSDDGGYFSSALKKSTSKRTPNPVRTGNFTARNALIEGGTSDI